MWAIFSFGGHRSLASLSRTNQEHVKPVTAENMRWISDVPSKMVKLVELGGPFRPAEGSGSQSAVTAVPGSGYSSLSSVMGSERMRWPVAW